MEVDINSNKIIFDGRKSSLLVSYIRQKFEEEEFIDKIDDKLIRFIDLIPKMEPEHLVVLRWHAGYELGHPMDYYGVGAIACKSIKPWKHHLVDHLIQDRNPFAKIIDSTLLAQIVLNYDSKIANLKEGYDSMNLFFASDVTLRRALKKVGFQQQYSELAGFDEDVAKDNFEDSAFDLLDKLHCKK
ncbi:MAG: hypothetical protein L6266_04640 [Nanoarchaeota archaeon]|nr:hypothetical protein [Nanoarchaeota archaeon]